MVEIKENVLTGHRAKLLEHTTGQKEKSHPVYAHDQLYLSRGSPGAELPPTRDVPQGRGFVIFSSVPHCTLILFMGDLVSV